MERLSILLRIRVLAAHVGPSLPLELTKLPTGKRMEINMISLSNNLLIVHMPTVTMAVLVENSPSLTTISTTSITQSSETTLITLRMKFANITTLLTDQAQK
jgi:hypothetical protein